MHRKRWTGAGAESGDGTLLASLPRTNVPAGLRLSPDGQQLLAWAGADLDITNLQTGRTAVRFTLPARLDCVVWRSDGHGLACGGEDGHIYAVDASDGTVQRECVGPTSRRFASWRSTRTSTCSPALRGMARCDSGISATATRSSALRGALGSFSSCGRWLGFVAGQSVGRWEVSDVPWTMVLAEGDQTVRYIDFSRDGALIFSGNQQDVTLWDAVSGWRLATVPQALQVREHPTREAWVVAGMAGAHIWPYCQDGHVLRVGPPEATILQPCD